MNPIEFCVIGQSVIQHLTRNNPLPKEALDTYLSVRPGIMEQSQCDIFCENSRSVTQKWKDFSLFHRINQVLPNTVIVFPFWLELFESHCRENIKICLDWMKSQYPNNPIVLQWNHDRDAATVSEFKNLPENFFVLQFNTSKPTKNDILLPFWVINTDPPIRDKEWLAGFVGYVGSLPTRKKLHKILAYRQGDDYYFSRERISENDWLGLVSSFKFSLCPRGGGLNSYRFYESIHCGSIPVLFSDDVVLPYPGLNYYDFIIRLPENKADDFNYLDGILKKADYHRMLQKLFEVRTKFSLLGVQMEIFNRLARVLR